MSHPTCSHCHIWLKGLVRVISPHPIHACALGCFLSVYFLSFYLLSKSFFHLFLIPAMVPDENSMEDPLCNSAIGSMVSLDYVTPDTRNASYSAPCFAQQWAHALRQSTEVFMVLTPSLREGGLRTLWERPCAQVQGRRWVAPVIWCTVTRSRTHACVVNIKSTPQPP